MLTGQRVHRHAEATARLDLHRPHAGLLRADSTAVLDLERLSGRLTNVFTVLVNEVDLQRGRNAALDADDQLDLALVDQQCRGARLEHAPVPGFELGCDAATQVVRRSVMRLL